MQWLNHHAGDSESLRLLLTQVTEHMAQGYRSSPGWRKMKHLDNSIKRREGIFQRNAPGCLYVEISNPEKYVSTSYQQPTITALSSQIALCRDNCLDVLINILDIYVSDRAGLENLWILSTSTQRGAIQPQCCRKVYSLRLYDISFKVRQIKYRLRDGHLSVLGPPQYYVYKVYLNLTESARLLRG